jgi:hypothetical protein
MSGIDAAVNFDICGAMYMSRTHDEKGMVEL